MVEINILIYLFIYFFITKYLPMRDERTTGVYLSKLKVWASLKRATFQIFQFLTFKKFTIFILDNELSEFII